MKGISPLIAAVLLIAIVIAVGSLTLDWMTGIHRATTSNIGNKTSTCTTAGVVIDNVYLDLGTSRGRLIVRNTGYEQDSIVAASIVTQRGQSSSNLTQFPINLGQGAQVNILLNISDIITSCSNFSRAFVSTGCSVSAEFGTGVQKPTCV